MTACSGASETQPNPRQLAELDAAVEAWERGDRSDYAYIYLRTCQCAEPEPQGPNTVFVVDGNINSVEHFGSREALEGFSADDLFDRIRQAVTDGGEVAVTYDQTTGFPSSINLDLQAGSDDDPLILEIHSFLSFAEHRTRLTDARTRWQAAGLADYHIIYQAPSTDLVEVEVRDGVAAGGSGSALPERIVADFFDELDAAIAERPDSIAIAYDQNLGYPTSYRVEQLSDRRAVIQFESIEVTREP